MIEGRRMHNRSRIAIMKGSSLEDKENVSNKTKNSKGHLSGTYQSNRRTLAAKDNVNVKTKPETKSSKVKSTPNFEKVHRNWESKLAKKKATTKRPNTKIEPFNLTKEVSKKNGQINDDFVGDDDEVADCNYEDESSEKGFSTEMFGTDGTTKKVDCLPGGVESKTFVTPASKEQFKVPTTSRKNLSSVKKKIVPNNHDTDPFDFQPDSDSLKSILNNVGVDPSRMRDTPNKMMPFCSRSPYQQKRASIYYTGRRPDLPPSRFEQRLSMRQASTIDEFKDQRLTTPGNRFQPMSTLVGIQETNSRYSVTPQKEYAMECNDLPEDATVLRSQTSNATRPKCASSDEISWADTLKYYSQCLSSDAPCDKTSKKTQGTGALVAQLEEEVIRNLAAVELASVHEISPGKQQQGPNNCISQTKKAGVYPTGVYVQQNPSVFRRLFPSPSQTGLDHGEIMSHHERWSTNNHNKQTLNNQYVSDEPGNASVVHHPVTAADTKSTKISDNDPILDGAIGNELARDISNSSLVNTVPRPPLINIKDNTVSASRPAGFVTIQNMAVIKDSRSLIKPNDTPSLIGLPSQINNRVSAFVRTPSVSQRTTSERLNLINTDRVNAELVVPTPVRPNPCDKLREKLYLDGTTSKFMSRHREIMRDSLVKSRDHAHEILLDAEVSLYARNIEFSRKKKGFIQRLENPLAKLFIKGDEKHFVPVQD